MIEEIYRLPILGISADEALETLKEFTTVLQKTSLNSQIVEQFIGADTTEKKVPLEISDEKYIIEDFTINDVYE